MLGILSLRQVSIKLRLTIILVILIIGFSFFGLATFKAMSTLNVNGPIYQRIVQGKDIIADVLPPPEYILESYMVALELTTAASPTEIKTLITRFNSLKAEYETRHQFWMGQSLEPALNLQLLDKSFQAAMAFYAEAEQRFLPSIENHQTAQWPTSLQTMRQHYQAHRQAIDEVVKYTTQRNTNDEMEAQQVIRSYHMKLLGIFLTSIITAIVMTVMISLGILSSLKSAKNIAGAIASGSLDTKIDTTEHSEMGELLASLNTMQAQIAKRSKANLVMIEETTRLKRALDTIGVCVMVADSDRNIIYMNPAATEMLKVAEADIQKVMPSFAVNKLVGSNADEYHRTPDHAKNLLSHLNSTHRAEINIGGRTFRMMANPVNHEGKRLGTVVEWLDRTEEVRIEKNVADVVSAAVKGDFSLSIGKEGKEGFFLLLADSINQLVETNASSLGEVVRVLDALARGDLTENIVTNFTGTYGKLRDSTNTTASNLLHLIADIKTSTETINTASIEIAAGNNDLSRRTEQQAASLEKTASSMSQFTQTVQDNADNAKQANLLALGASDIAHKGVDVVNQVVTTMDDINDASRRIGDIISVIDDIAFQTNILALNAAVEAARAGEQGKGFAVVAIEVRNLAQRAAGAAGEIKELIQNSVEKVSGGSKLVTEAGETMKDIVEAIQRVTNIMSDITASSLEQSNGIKQVNMAIGQLDGVTQQNAALVEQAAAAAESLQDQAQYLAQTVANFKVL